MVDENKLNIDDILLEYYILKNKYEKNYYDKYVNPIVTSNISKLSKRQKFQELNKPLCINCKQPVGTIFERKYYEKYDYKTELIIFTAKCGNILNPCDLNIEIHKSLRENYDNLIKENTEILNKYQMEIIKLKNRILFLGKNNINESQYIDEFEGYKKQILYYSERIGEYTEENILINDNPEENLKLQNLISSLNQQEIMQFKDYIKQYMDTNNDNFLSSAINMYVNEIIPKLNEIRALKYKTMYINKDENGNHILIQSKYSPEGSNFYDEYVDEVVNFIKGSKVESTKKNKLEISDKIEQEKSQKEKNKKNKTLKKFGKTIKTKTQKKQLKISDDQINEEEKEQSQSQKQEQEEQEEEELSFSKPMSSILKKNEEEQEEQEEEEEEEEELSFSKPISKIRKNNEEPKEEPIFTQKTLKNAPKKMGKNIILNEATEAL